MKIRLSRTEFACYSKACAPPPAGTGGSKLGGATGATSEPKKGAAGPGMTHVSKFGMKFSEPGAVVEQARKRTDWDEQPLKKVKISEIRATEEHVKQKHIDKILNGEPLRKGYDPQIVIDARGTAWVADGNHRVAMHAALGHKEINARVLDLRPIIAACYAKSCAPPPVGKGGSSKAHIIAHKHAKNILTTAGRNADAITSDIREVIERNGGAMSGLDHRLKGLASLRRKIHDKAVEKGISIDDSAAKITDAIRFTGVVDTGNYAKAVRQTIRSLEKKGYTVYDVENHWSRGDAYNGLHLLARHKSGAVAELQLHTKESIKAKNDIHGYYEKFRLHDTPKAEKRKLFDTMVSISDQAPIPPGIQGVGMTIKRPFND